MAHFLLLLVGDFFWYHLSLYKLKIGGRIGTSSPELGVPTAFSDISSFEAICEIAESKAGYNPELSYGSHIFQDLVEAQILYTAVFADKKTLHFHPELLKQEENIISDIPQGAKWRDVVWLADISQRDCVLYHDLKKERVLLQF